MQTTTAMVDSTEGAGVSRSVAQRNIAVGSAHRLTMAKLPLVGKGGHHASPRKKPKIERVTSLKKEKQPIVESRMTDEELTEWKQKYKTSETLHGALIKETPKLHVNYVAVLAELGMKRHDPDAFVRVYNRLFRWVYTSTATINGSAMGCIKKSNEDTLVDSVLSDGHCLVFQLFVRDKWQEYFYVGNSKLAPFRHGLFASREFPVGSTIGWYAGCQRTNWDLSQPG